MKTIHIKSKLEEIGVPLTSVNMGAFDYIGEFTAKRQRSQEDPNFHKYGAFYRSNYERGMLIYYLIRRYNLTSMLEIGFGRGYSTFCAAKAFYDSGIDGKITTVDPALDEKQVGMLQQVLPRDWFKHVVFMKGTSQAVVPTLDAKFDLVYVDGDHSYAGTKADWEMIKTKWNSFVLFDDYHLPSKDDPGIKCREAIDEIDWKSEGFDEPELIKMDRRIFIDERHYTDDQIDYGQCLFSKAGIGNDDW